MDKQNRREKWLREHPRYNDRSYVRVRDTVDGARKLREQQRRVRNIIELRTVHKRTIEFIAQGAGISSQRVSQILKERGVAGKIIGLVTKKSMEKKSIKVQVFLSESKAKALDALMLSDKLDVSRGLYIDFLISAELKRREESSEKRAVGRPRNSDKQEIDDVEAVDYSADIPKNIPYFGRMIGKREYADIQELSNAFKSGL